MPSVIVLNVIMLNVIMLSVIMLSVIVVNVVAPLITAQKKFYNIRWLVHFPEKNLIDILSKKHFH